MQYREARAHALETPLVFGVRGLLLCALALAAAAAMLIEYRQKSHAPEGAGADAAAADALPAAYTALAATPDDWPHCLVRGQQLRDLGSSLRLLCATPKLPPHVLREAAAVKLGVDFVPLPPMRLPPWRKFKKRVQANWRASWGRLGLLNVTTHAALIYMDLDIVLTRHVDELAATVSPAMPFAITYGQNDCSYPYGINGGTLVFAPSAALATELDEFVAQPRTEEQSVATFSQSDQSTLRVFLGTAGPAGRSGDKHPTVLSYVYNTGVRHCNCDGFDKTGQGSVAAWHFTYSAKPWEERRSGSACEQAARDLYWHARDAVDAKIFRANSSAPVT